MQYTTQKEQPLISVIVPVYNTASLLPRCIESILNQTHKNLELILVNDGSTDGSGDVCDEYAKKDTRVGVIHQENRGNSAARNTGLDAARGEWFALVDSDDYINSKMYEKLLAAATLQNTFLSACGFIYKQLNKDDTVENVFPNVPPKITATECIEMEARKISLFAHCTTLYHRKIINTPMTESGESHEVGGKTLPLRYDEAIHKGADRVFFVEALLRAGELAYIPEALHIYDCTREDNTTNSPFSEKKITLLISRKKLIELFEPVSPKGAQRERQKLMRDAFSLMRKALLSEHAHLNALYPECRKAAKGCMGLLLTAKRIKLKRKIKYCTIYLFPRFARTAWKLRGSLKRKRKGVTHNA